jgi:hypothetical protein
MEVALRREQFAITWINHFFWRQVAWIAKCSRTWIFETFWRILDVCEGSWEGFWRFRKILKRWLGGYQTFFDFGWEPAFLSLNKIIGFETEVNHQQCVHCVWHVQVVVENASNIPEGSILHRWLVSQGIGMVQSLLLNCAEGMGMFRWLVNKTVNEASWGIS